MGRRGVIFKKFKEYNLLHTHKVRMMSGVYTTILFPIKETEQYYRSIEVWASCTHTFKRKKKNLELGFCIPEITSEKTTKFLEDNCWADWVDREIESGDTDMIECIAYLDKLFPDKKKKFFYELDSIIGAYQWGNFESFDDNDKPEKLSDNDIKMQKYYCSKYKPYIDVPEIKVLRDAYHKEENAEKKQKLFTIYHDAEKKYVFEHFNTVDELTDIGRNAVCYPVAFSKGTADWHKEKYKKICSYAHAGEIYFVVTEDCVYFCDKRHF